MDFSAHILLVRHTLAARDPVSDILCRNDFSVIVVNDGAEMQRLLSLGNIDVLILDVTTPRTDAANRWEQVCSAGNPPVIMLAAPGTEPGAVCALQSGATDYITKPFSDRELLARVRGVLRRTRWEASEAPSR
jgi:two-component system, OmpR family, response regulator